MVLTHVDRTRPCTNGRPLLASQRDSPYARTPVFRLEHHHSGIGGTADSPWFGFDESLLCQPVHGPAPRPGVPQGVPGGDEIRVTLVELVLEATECALAWQ